MLRIRHKFGLEFWQEWRRLFLFYGCRRLKAFLTEGKCAKFGHQFTSMSP